MIFAMSRPISKKISKNLRPEVSEIQTEIVLKCYIYYVKIIDISKATNYVYYFFY